MDETTKEIVAVDLTRSGVYDSTHLPAVLEGVPGEVGQVSGDRAYDSGSCSETILARAAVPTIAPRRNARFSRAKDPPPYWLERDAVLRRIKAEGRYVWRTASGATRQSLAENAVSRFKALLGVKLVSRNFENQQVEALVKCQVLNRMAALGLPRSEHSAGLSCPEREDGGSGCVEAGLRNNAILPQRNRYEEQEWYKGRPQSYTCLLFGEISETDYPQSVRAAFGKEACEVYQTWAYMKE